MMNFSNEFDYYYGSNSTFLGEYEYSDDDVGPPKGGPRGPGDDANLTFVIEGVILSAVCVAGFVGNALAFVVMMRCSVREAFSHQVRDVGFRIHVMHTHFNNQVHLNGMTNF